jgi:hypothetical protein
VIDPESVFEKSESKSVLTGGAPRQAAGRRPVKQDARDVKRTFGQVPIDSLRRLAESGSVSARGVSQHATDEERMEKAIRWLWNELDDIREAREPTHAKPVSWLRRRARRG